MNADALARHPEELVAQLERDCRRLTATLEHLAHGLEQGAGAPVPGELTPDEYGRVAAALGVVGIAGYELLRSDAARTTARELGRQ